MIYCYRESKFSVNAMKSLIDFRRKDMLNYALEIFLIFSLTETIEEKNGKWIKMYYNELQTSKRNQDAFKTQ